MIPEIRSGNEVGSLVAGSLWPGRGSTSKPHRHPSHWLASGTDGRIGAVVEGTRIFTPLTLDEGTNVGRYAGLDDLIASGIVWEEGRAQLAHKSFLMHQGVGRGQIVAFAEDPNYRSYAEATQLLFVNAVLLGAGR